MHSQAFLAAEEDNAEAAVEDIRRTGHTDRVCLLCGGELKCNIKPSGYSVKCVREGRTVLSVRGI